MRKKRIFIGSSSEELSLAESAKKILEPEFEVTIWNDNVWDTAVFKINNNFLPRNDSDNHPINVIKITEVIISTPGISYGK